MRYLWLALLITACSQSGIDVSGQWSDPQATFYQSPGPNCPGFSQTLNALATLSQSGNAVIGNFRFTDSKNNSITLDITSGYVNGATLYLTTFDKTHTFPDFKGSFTISGNAMAGAFSGADINNCPLQLSFNFKRNAP